MSELVLDESSNSNDSSSDDELNMIKKNASDKNLKRMIKSSDIVDKRILNQCLIQIANRLGNAPDFKNQSVLD